jgi:NAD(P)-dependent dehydrogenase (short-subunit alcohol dehydrogenase family)
MASIESTKPVALITGAGSGIGRAAAGMLAREGYRVVLVGRDDAKLDAVAAEIGRDLARPYPADVGYAGACHAMIDFTVRLHGRLDVVINNAGWTPLMPLQDMDHEDVRRIFEINALGPIWTTQWACRQFAFQADAGLTLAAGRTPCIVTVSSQSSTDPFPGLGVYGAAKAAVNILALATARECPGVRAFAIAPGAVETPLLRSIIAESQLPRERCLQPADVARVILDCVLGAYDDQNGRTIAVPSP